MKNPVSAAGHLATRVPAASELTIATRPGFHALTLVLAGDLGFGADRPLQAVWEHLDLRSRPTVVLDFGGVYHANSAGLSALLIFLTDLKEHTQDVSFTGLEPGIERIMRTIGFHRIVKF